MNERKQILDNLISLEQPIDLLLAQLRTYPWDSDTELAFLSLKHLGKVLRLFTEGSFSPSEVERWANAIEGREDIGFEGNPELQREIVHELANPQLSQVLSIQRAREILSRLELEARKEE